MEERIRKWQEEIERTTARQKEMNQSCNEKIRELKRKMLSGIFLLPVATQSHQIKISMNRKQI